MACKAKNMLELKIFCMTQAQAIRALRPGGAKFCATLRRFQFCLPLARRVNYLKRRSRSKTSSALTNTSDQRINSSGGLIVMRTLIGGRGAELFCKSNTAP